MSRARRSRPGLTTVLWRDIPAQVIATDGHETVKVVLPNRFQVAIDRAARIADKSDMNAYVQEWRRDLQPLTGDPETAAHAMADAINRSFSRERLAGVVAAGGVATDNEPGAAAADPATTGPADDERGPT